MQSTVQQISEILKSDETLLGMLGLNPPIGIPGGDLSAVNSILPVDKVKRKMATPFVTMQEGAEAFIGYTLKKQTVYIRCYNDLAKSYIEINRILDRVRELIHRTPLDLSDRTSIECLCEGRLAALEDEGFELRFKEEKYGISVL